MKEMTLSAQNQEDEEEQQEDRVEMAQMSKDSKTKIDEATMAKLKQKVTEINEKLKTLTDKEQLAKTVKEYMVEIYKLPKAQRTYIYKLLKAQAKKFMEVRAEIRLEHLFSKISDEKKKAINTKVAEFVKTYVPLAANQKCKAMKKFKQSIKSYSFVTF